MCEPSFHTHNLVKQLAAEGLKGSVAEEFVEAIFKARKYDLSRFLPLLHEAVDCMEKNDYEQAIQLLMVFVNHEDATVRQQANGLINLSYFRLKQYPEAVFYGQKACSTSKRFEDWFNLSIAYTLTKDVSGAQKVFRQVIRYIPKKQRNLIHKLRYYYIKALLEVKEYSVAFEQLEILKEMYQLLRTSNDHLLYMHGLPFFTQFMETAIEVLNGLPNNFDKKRWLHDFGLPLDEEGKQTIQAFCLRLVCRGNIEKIPKRVIAFAIVALAMYLCLLWL